MEYHLRKAASDAVMEAMRGFSIHGAHHSYHEGWAVALEEFDELWDEIKANGDDARVAEEALQAAAMCLRIVVMARRRSK